MKRHTLTKSRVAVLLHVNLTDYGVSSLLLKHVDIDPQISKLVPVLNEAVANAVNNMIS